MGKRLIITESEKNNIRKMYGLIIENKFLLKESDDDEIIAYMDYYLKSKSCDDIAGDMEAMQQTPAYTELSKDEKEQYDKAIMGLKHPGLAITSGKLPCDANILSKDEVKCQCVKDYMRGEFTKQLSGENRQKVIVQICGFTKQFPPQTPLNVCQTKQDDNASTKTEQPGTATPEQPGTATPEQPGTATPEQPGTATPDAGTGTQPGTENPAQTKTEQPAQTGAVDSDYKLDTPQKIQEFQTWMDRNHGKWAYSKKYNRNYSVDGKPNKGFGNMGPNTKKAWDNTEYKNAYLKEKGLVKKEVKKEVNKPIVEPKVVGSTETMSVDDL